MRRPLQIPAARIWSTSHNGLPAQCSEAGIGYSRESAWNCWRWAAFGRPHAIQPSRSVRLAPCWQNWLACAVGPYPFSSAQSQLVTRAPAFEEPRTRDPGRPSARPGLDRNASELGLQGQLQGARRTDGELREIRSQRRAAKIGECRAAGDISQVLLVEGIGQIQLQV
jgi:hypothetical protein